MDPFREDFDVDQVLASLPTYDVQPCASFSQFEQMLVADQPEALAALLKIEDKENKLAKAFRKPSTKERLKGLQAICVPDAQPLQPRPVKKADEKRVKQIETGEGRVFAVGKTTDVYGRMEDWMADKSRVCVKLRSHAASHTHQEPNRMLQGVIVAFDKHWNLILRDVDENLRKLTENEQKKIHEKCAGKAVEPDHSTTPASPSIASYTALYSTKQGQICTAVFISPVHLLSVRSCLLATNRSATLTLRQAFDREVEVPVDLVAYENLNQGQSHQLAIIQLKEPLAEKLSQQTKFVCLPHKNSPIPVNTVIYGWNISSNTYQKNPIEVMVRENKGRYLGVQRSTDVENLKEFAAGDPILAYSSALANFVLYGLQSIASWTNNGEIWSEGILLEPLLDELCSRLELCMLGAENSKLLKLRTAYRSSLWLDMHEGGGGSFTGYGMELMERGGRYCHYESSDSRRMLGNKTTTFMNFDLIDGKVTLDATQDAFEELRFDLSPLWTEEISNPPQILMKICPYREPGIEYCPGNSVFTVCYDTGYNTRNAPSYRNERIQNNCQQSRSKNYGVDFSFKDDPLYMNISLLYRRANDMDAFRMSFRSNSKCPMTVTIESDYSSPCFYKWAPGRQGVFGNNGGYKTLRSDRKLTKSYSRTVVHRQSSKGEFSKSEAKEYIKDSKNALESVITSVKEVVASTAKDVESTIDASVQASVSASGFGISAELSTSLSSSISNSMKKGFSETLAQKMSEKMLKEIKNKLETVRTLQTTKKNAEEKLAEVQSTTTIFSQQNYNVAPGDYSEVCMMNKICDGIQDASGISEEFRTTRQHP